MKKDHSLEVLGVLIILVLLALSINIYENEYKEDSNYPINTEEYKTKLNNFSNNYSVNVSFDDPSNLNGDYVITPIDYSKRQEAVSYVEDYLLLFNKHFFSHFYEYGMSGLDIYFADNISGIKNGYNTTSVIGLSFIKNNKYIMVISLNSDNSVTEILAHETMHIIDYYLNAISFNYEWDKLNPEGFSYSHTYYKNNVFKDTINGNYDNDAIYFVDNYSRSSENEDRARIFEYIILRKSLSKYPHLNNKKEYLKNVLLKVFPELNETNIFKNY